MLPDRPHERCLRARERGRWGSASLRVPMLTGMRPTEVVPQTGHAPSSSCQRCVDAARSALPAAQAFADASVFVACACDGRAVASVVAIDPDVLRTAASVAKLAWVLAAVSADADQEVDLAAPLPLSVLPVTRYRDVLAVLPTDAALPLVELLGLALVTSANPVFDYLCSLPPLARYVDRVDGLVAVSGFSDRDLAGPVHANRVTARTAAELLVQVLRLPGRRLGPLRWGLVNGARTTRLVRDVESVPGLPEGLCFPNKTGTLSGVRNDVAAFTDGSACLVVAVLAGTGSDASASVVDDQMAALGSVLVRHRFARLR